MQRFFLIIGALLTLVGCEIMSEEPLLDVADARQVTAGFEQTVRSIDTDGSFLVATAQPDGWSVLLTAFGTQDDGTLVQEPPDYVMRFYPLPGEAGIFLTEAFSIDPQTDQPVSEGVFHGLVTCDSGGNLAWLTMDLPAVSQVTQGEGYRVNSEWGLLTVLNREALLQVVGAVISGNHLIPVTMQELDLNPDDAVACAELFVDIP